DTVAARRQSLEEMQHQNGGVMLVDTDIITDDYITLVSWASDASKRLYKYETFQYMGQHQVLYIFSGLGTADENQRNRGLLYREVVEENFDIVHKWRYLRKQDSVSMKD